MNVIRERLTFGSAVDKVVVWLIVGLMSWLCVSTLQLREQMAVLIDQSTARQQNLQDIRDEIKTMHTTDVELRRKIQQLRDENLRHGWER